LEAALHTPAPARRIDVLHALAKRGGAEVVPILRRVAAADQEQHVTQAAIEACARVGTPDAIDALIGLMADPARRDTCVQALAHLGEEQVALVAGGLAHPDAGVRRAVVEALARMKRPHASEHLVAALDDGEASVRLAATLALGQLGSRYAERRLVLLARSDPDLAVRRAAHTALQR
jgi:HEAT repeat protein